MILFKRGISPKDSLGIGRDRFIKAFSEMLLTDSPEDRNNCEKMIHRIEIRSKPPSLKLYYEHGAGILAEDKFPEILNGIMDLIPYRSDWGIDPYTKIKMAVYSYHLDSAYYNLFKDILKEIND